MLDYDVSDTSDFFDEFDTLPVSTEFDESDISAD